MCGIDILGQTTNGRPWQLQKYFENKICLLKRQQIGYFIKLLKDAAKDGPGKG